jgi:hypothetical protein
MDDQELGKCIKTNERVVLSQNDLSLKTCGDMGGEICTKGCMATYSPIIGMTLIKNSIINNETVDAVVINNGETLTTFLYAKTMNEEEKKKENEKLLSFGLSKSELALFLLVVEGKKNSQIIKELFISKSTLKTHLNNIYKKLPETYQQYKNRR